MGLVPKIKVGEFDLVDTFVITASKIIGERLFAATPVGNGTVISGAVKGATAFGIASLSKGSKTAKMIATGIAVDAAEDVLRGINPFGLFGTGATAAVDSGVVLV